MTRAAKPLESALLFTFVVHGIAMLTMAAFLLPGMPGGPHLDVASRAAYVASHRWLWRIGWLGWQLTALSDLLLAVALLVTRWIPKLPAILTLIVTIMAIIPDQYGQAMWTWQGVHLAQQSPAAYAAFESRIFRMIGGYATIGYLIGALGWTWCFAAAGTWNRFLTKLSWAAWGIFAVAIAAIFLPLPAWAGKITSATNAIGFVLLMVWLIAVTEPVLRRSRPTTATGHWAIWRHPTNRLLNLFANSRFVRFIFEHLPILAMASDITNVIYINYLVPAEKLEPLVPPFLRLQRLGQDQSLAMFSILTYRHGHFGPICFGPFRRWWPSPIQSNWRIYVVDPQTQKLGVHFVTTAITSTPHALATRLLSEGVPMHIPAQAQIDRDDSGTFKLLLDPGTGTAPDLHGEFTREATAQLPPSWQQSFPSWDQMLTYCVPLDRALASQPWYDQVVRQEIALGIPLDSCLPLSGEVQSNIAEQIVGDALPVSFLVEDVEFRFFGEVFDLRFSSGLRHRTPF